MWHYRHCVPVAILCGVMSSSYLKFAKQVCLVSKTAEKQREIARKREVAKQNSQCTHANVQSDYRLNRWNQQRTLRATRKYFDVLKSGSLIAFFASLGFNSSKRFSGEFRAEKCKYSSLLWQHSRYKWTTINFNDSIREHWPMCSFPEIIPLFRLLSFSLSLEISRGRK